MRGWFQNWGVDTSLRTIYRNYTLQWTFYLSFFLTDITSFFLTYSTYIFTEKIKLHLLVDFFLHDNFFLFVFKLSYTRTKLHIFVASMAWWLITFIILLTAKNLQAWRISSKLLFLGYIKYFTERNI